jgi:hypothetical protein
VAYEIAKQKGAKTFEFTDNSTRVVQDRKIILSDLSFLTTGKTWYERILPSIHPLNERDKTDIEKARIIVKKNKWIDVYNNLLKIYNIDVNFDTTGIDIHNEGSAMKVLDRAKKSKKYAFFFDSEMYSLLASSFVISLHGKHWIMNI